MTNAARLSAPEQVPQPDELRTDIVRVCAGAGSQLGVSRSSLDSHSSCFAAGRPSRATRASISASPPGCSTGPPYTQTIENKDPLFFYSYAAALWIGGWRGPFLLDGVWFALAAVGIGLLMRELRLQRSAIVAGFFIYPLALSSGWYLAGESTLGGVAIAPFAAWLWLRGRFTASGVVLAVVMLLKLNLIAIGAAPIAAFLLLGAPAGRRLAHLLRGIGGLVGALAAAALVLALRGELSQYLYIIRYNAWYSGRSIATMVSSAARSTTSMSSSSTSRPLVDGSYRQPSSYSSCSPPRGCSSYDRAR